MFFGFRPVVTVTPETALPGSSEPLFAVPERHRVLDTPLQGPYPEGTELLYVGMGCFWGTERLFWALPGVVTTATGYMGGYTPNPTYGQVCTGMTGHAETVLVAYDPARIPVTELLRVFWENHDSTTADRQGNDVGTQYRSAIFWTTEAQREAAELTRTAYQQVLTESGRGEITTQIAPAGDGPGGVGTFWFAEAEHQQYLDANPGGYCNHGPNGCSLPPVEPPAR